MENTVKKGDRLSTEITDINNLGCGIGHAPDGRVIFIKGAVTGDVVNCEIIKVNSSFLVGRLLETTRLSECREDGFCQAPLSCGGCVYRHVTYEHEREIKRGFVKAAFAKAGLRDVTVLPVRSTDKTAGYRNKAQYPVAKTKNGTRAGFFASKTHNIVPAEDCSLQNAAFAPIVKEICRFADEYGISAYDEQSGNGILRHIYLRIAEKTGEIMLCLVINKDKLSHSEDFVSIIREKFPGVVGILLSINKKNTNVVLGDKFVTLFGRDYIEDELCGLRFRVSADSFYQVNRDGAEMLYRLAAELADLKGGEVLMDLYCGTGTIGLSMASRVKKLIGIEVVSAAVDCARENAARNGIENAEFFCADAGDRETILRAAGGVRPDVVVIDPPRKGSTKELVDCLASLGVPKIVYVSCDPTTLARDCAWFREAGYMIGDVTPVDMFPRTGHVESVVCLTRHNELQPCGCVN